MDGTLKDQRTMLVYVFLILHNQCRMKTSEIAGFRVLCANEVLQQQILQKSLNTFLPEAPELQHLKRMASSDTVHNVLPLLAISANSC